MRLGFHQNGLSCHASLRQLKSSSKRRGALAFLPAEHRHSPQTRVLQCLWTTTIDSPGPCPLGRRCFSRPTRSADQPLHSSVLKSCGEKWRVSSQSTQYRLRTNIFCHRSECSPTDRPALPASLSFTAPNTIPSPMTSESSPIGSVADSSTRINKLQTRHRKNPNFPWLER